MKKEKEKGKDGPNLTKCCEVTAFAEPLYLLAKAPNIGKRRFGYIPLCSGCFKVVGQWKHDWSAQDPELKKIQDRFNETSWLMMKEHHPHPPFLFEVGSTGMLVPENYKGELKTQASLLPPEEEMPPED